MKEKSHKFIWIMSGILAVVSIVVMYKTNRAIPFMMDDLWYSTILSDDSIPITSFADIVKSQIWHYNNWGGRCLTHGMLQITLLAGEHVADILNMVFTLLLVGMVCLMADDFRMPALFAALAMVLGLNANWRESMFWQAGAANYLYITVFLLAFAYCYLRELQGEGSIVPWKISAGKFADRTRKEPEQKSVDRTRKEPEQKSADRTPREPKQRESVPGITLWIIPLGILAGWSNENMGPAVWVLSVLAIILTWVEKRKIKIWMILGSLACLSGSIICIVAPGNFVRVNRIEEEQYGIVWRLFLRGYRESKAALEFLFPTLLLLGVLLFVSKCVLKQKIGRRNKLLLFCALLSWGAMALSPHYPDRATFGTMVLCICVILSTIKKILRQRGDLALPLWGGMALVWLRGMFFCGEYLAVLWGWIK